jgi:murein peptide amidase A
MLVERSKRGRVHHRSLSYGTSVNGTPLQLYHPPDGSVEYLLIAAHHGDEPETTVVLSSALRSVPPESLKSAVILVANPDGLMRGCRGNANGVDLNRNFPTSDWGTIPIRYRWTMDSPRDVELSAGCEGGSEPETQALIKLVKELLPKAIITLHAPLDCIDDVNGSTLAQWIATRTELPVVKDVGYPTPGSFGTWARENNQNLITFELGNQSIETSRARFEETLVKLLLADIDLS